MTKKILHFCLQFFENIFECILFRPSFFSPWRGSLLLRQILLGEPIALHLILHSRISQRTSAGFGRILAMIGDASSPFVLKLWRRNFAAHQKIIFVQKHFQAAKIVGFQLDSFGVLKFLWVPLLSVLLLQRLCPSSWVASIIHPSTVCLVLHFSPVLCVSFRQTF